MHHTVISLKREENRSSYSKGKDFKDGKAIERLYGSTKKIVLEGTYLQIVDVIINSDKRIEWYPNVLSIQVIKISGPGLNTLVQFSKPFKISIVYQGLWCSIA